jgi:hypothetical protein
LLLLLITNAAFGIRVYVYIYISKNINYFFICIYKE